MQRPDINKLKELKAKATKGSWGDVPMDGYGEASWVNARNERYIAALHNANLIQYIEELEQTIKEARAEFVKELEELIPPFSADERDPMKHVYQNQGYSEAIDTLINKYKEV